MAYTNIIMLFITGLCLAYFTWTLTRLRRDLCDQVEAAIHDEVRKQDERIEKRYVRARDAVETGVDGQGHRAEPQIGQPYHG